MLALCAATTASADDLFRVLTYNIEHAAGGLSALVSTVQQAEPDS